MIEDVLRKNIDESSEESEIIILENIKLMQQVRNKNI